VIARDKCANFSLSSVSCQVQGAPISWCVARGLSSVTLLRPSLFVARTGGTGTVNARGEAALNPVSPRSQVFHRSADGPFLEIRLQAWCRWSSRGGSPKGAQTGSRRVTNLMWVSKASFEIRVSRAHGSVARAAGPFRLPTTVAHSHLHLGCSMAVRRAAKPSTLSLGRKLGAQKARDRHSPHLRLAKHSPANP
jgi:hypothetical protein